MAMSSNSLGLPAWALSLALEYALTRLFSLMMRPFWRMASQKRRATYVQLNKGEVLVPSQLEQQSIVLDCDAAAAFSAMRERLD